MGSSGVATSSVAILLEGFGVGRLVGIGVGRLEGAMVGESVGAGVGRLEEGFVEGFVRGLLLIDLKDFEVLLDFLVATAVPIVVVGL